MDAVNQAGLNANQQWIASAAQTVRKLAKLGQPFTTEQVWEQTKGYTHEPRAMGHVVRAAAKAGIIKPTGRWIETVRVIAHHRPMREWIGVEHA